MDAHALLTSQGWRGSGNSLHPTSNSIGLSKPLLVSKKHDTIGLGKKAHRTSDMWWMNAFDSSLKGLDTSKEGQVVQTITSGGLDMVTRGGAKWVGSKGGLYSSFVRGECLSGTITPEESDVLVQSEGKKRKREGGETKEERRASKAAKKVVEEDILVEKEKTETKEERRARRAAKKVAVEKLVVEGKPEEEAETPNKETPKVETKEERRARKEAKRAVKEQETTETSGEVDPTTDMNKKSESKEDRRERKRLKKLAEEAKEGTIEDPSEKAKKKKRRKDLTEQGQ